MHGQQILPLSDAHLPVAGIGDLDLCPTQAASPDDATSTTATESQAAPAWMNAATAAEALGVSVRRLRKLATAGKVERRRRDGRTMYRTIGTQAPDGQSEPSEERTGRSEASRVTPETSPGEPTDGSKDPVRRSGGGRANPTGASDLRVTVVRSERGGQEGGAAEHPADACADTTVVLDERDVVYLADGVVPNELLATNRELMKLVDSVLDRWIEVSKDRTLSAGSLRQALERALSAQQCLLQWQDHAAWLDQQLMLTRHAVARALDVADEVLATSWKGRRRRAALGERVEKLRRQVGLD